MEVLDKIIEIIEEHPYMAAFGVIGCAIGFLIDMNIEKGEE